jgi:short-subunit dehydrogenase
MKEQYTLITGASNGIGKAIAECCAKRKMNLVLVSLPGENLEELSYSIANKNFVKVNFLELDLTEPHAAEELFNWCKEMDIEINILVNNAGIGYQGNFSDFDASFYKNLITLNVLALTMLTREFLPELMLRKNAYILNVSSFGGFYPMPFKTVYAASKSYVTTFSEALHEELKNSSVYVTTLCPAGVDSFEDSSERIDKIGWIAKLGRLKPSEVAEAAVSGMLNRRRRIIPGAINVLFHYLTRILPTRTKAWLVHFVLAKFHHSSEAHSEKLTEKIR